MVQSLKLIADFEEKVNKWFARLDGASGCKRLDGASGCKRLDGASGCKRLERLEAETQRKQQELKEWREERERQEKAGEWSREAYVERMNKEIDRNNALAEERRRHELSDARHYDYRRVAASDPETLVMEDSRKRLLTRIPAFADAGKTDSATLAHVAAVKRKLFCDEVLLKEKS